jgi:hypothetical protein
MKFGLSEMLIVGLIIVMILVASRFFPARTQPAPPAAPIRQLTAVEVRDAEIMRRRRSGFKWGSVLLVIVGLAILLSSFGLIKYIFLSQVWGVIILVIGVLIFFLARRQQ